MDRSGPRLTPHEATNGGDTWIDQAEAPFCNKMKATYTPMDYFAFRLSQLMDRPVVDLTDLHGDTISIWIHSELPWISGRRKTTAKSPMRRVLLYSRQSSSSWAWS